MAVRQLGSAILGSVVFWAAAAAAAAAPDGPVSVHLAAVPVLTPDGSRLIFVWNRDLWTVPTAGGRARPLTRHPANDGWPCISRDGTQLAFTSNRDGNNRVYVMPSEGGPCRPISLHTDGGTPLDWFPDDSAVLLAANRDQLGLRQRRLFRLETDGSGTETLVCDAYGDWGRLSPDGRRVLYTRHGVGLYRKGYRGSLSSRIWLYDRDADRHTLVCDHPGGSRRPLWRPDGKGFYYTSGRGECANLWEHDLDAGTDRPHTRYSDFSVIIPALSADGSTMVFRYGFDFYRYAPGSGGAPERIDILYEGDTGEPGHRRRWYSTAWNNDRWGALDWTDDGLEVVFTTGGDLWVMDTVQKAPVCVASGTLEHETEALWGPEENSILFLRDRGDAVHLCRATRDDPDAYWWQNTSFAVETLLDDDSDKHSLKLCPDDERIAFVRHGRQLCVAQLDGTGLTPVFEAVRCRDVHWSPDGKWLLCVGVDSSDNHDIWIVSADRSREPYNLTRHPDHDTEPVWSPDGKMIAFIGVRGRDHEADVHYVYLTRSDDEETDWARTHAEALERFRKARPPEKPEPPREAGKPPKPEEDEEEGEADEGEAEDGTDGKDGGGEADENGNGNENGNENGNGNGNGNENADDRGDDADAKKEKEEKPKKDLPAVTIEFDGLWERVRVVSQRNVREWNTFWSPDGRTLAFAADIKGRRGIYTVTFPDELTPKFKTGDIGGQPRWQRDKIRWLLNGKPATFAKGKTTVYDFKVFQHTDLAAYRRLGLRRIWRTLRDEFHDPALNNRDWPAVLARYEDVAASVTGRAAFARVVNMLLGELNASHMGYTENKREWKTWEPDTGWGVRTDHLGVLAEPNADAPGMRIGHVVPRSPADRPESKLRVGETVLRVDGVPVDSQTDLDRVLTGRYPRTVRVAVADAEGKERTVLMRPVSYGDVRKLRWEAWIERNRATVEEASGGRFTYLHIDRMQWPEFHRFEQEVFSLGYGRDGLIIDVRNNGGGLTSDHLLTILCRAQHAVTIPRGGERSYPRGYLVYRSWDKPVVLLCNQYTASNAEILCHAVQALERGRVVGVPSQGSVISTGSRKILDLGTMRVPHRTWFTAAGQDMELHGVQPDVVVPLRPGDIPSGQDPQLEAAIRVLTEDVAAWEARPKVPRTRVSER